MKSLEKHCVALDCARCGKRAAKISDSERAMMQMIVRCAGAMCQCGGAVVRCVGGAGDGF